MQQFTDELDRLLKAVQQFIAERLFPPIEQPGGWAAGPFTIGKELEKRANGTYHGDPKEDDKWPDQGGTP